MALAHPNIWAVVAGVSGNKENGRVVVLGVSTRPGCINRQDDLSLAWARRRKANVNVSITAES